MKPTSREINALLVDPGELEAIRRLTHLYSYYIDRFELDGLLELWMDDAIFDESGVGLRRACGLEAIRASFEEVFALMHTVVHYTTNFLLLEYGDLRARGCSYYLAEGVIKNGGTVRVTGYYEDNYRQTENGWRFQSRAAFFFNAPDLGSYQLAAGAR